MDSHEAGGSPSSIIVSITKCTGLFCGRVSPNSSLCTACPWGSRTELLSENTVSAGSSGSSSSQSHCLPCDTLPSLRDCLFLGANFLLPIILFLIAWTQTLSEAATSEAEGKQHNKGQSIEPLLAYYSKERDSDEAIQPTATLHNYCSYKAYLIPLLCIALHTCAFLLVLLLFPPLGSLTLVSCRPRGLEDFYSVFLAAPHCVSEAAFPFVSLPLAYYLASALLSLPTYCLFVSWCGVANASHLNLVYLALYTYPLLAVGHLLLCGLHYFTFHIVLLLLALAYSTYRMPRLFDYPSSTVTTSTVGKVMLVPARDPVTSLRYIRRSAGRSQLTVYSLGLITCTVAYALVCFSHEVVSYWLMAFALLPCLFYLIVQPLTHPFVYFDGKEAMEAAVELSKNRLGES